MGISAKDKEIDGHRIIVTSFGGRLGFQLKLQLLKTIGPGIAGLVSALPYNISASDIKKLATTHLDLSKIGSGIQSLLEQADEGKTLDLILRLLQCTRVDGKDLSNPLLFDDVFAEEFGLMYKVILFVVEVNWGSLFKMGSIINLVTPNQTILPTSTTKS
jgi:hypothetical protein